ncbi:hypothetical protein PInf_019717 [Phytophthora infestans]|nr:hypothetical protein PInf_019717 [Phytophthora infestans]
MQSSEARFDADGDAVMQNVQQPVFEFVQAPRLTNWSQDAAVSWKKRWEQYLSISGERLEAALRPVKTCVDPELLEVLCLYELRKAVDEVRSEELVTLIDAKLGSIDLREDDIDARVLKYYKDFATLIKENGLSKFLGVGDPADGGYVDRMKLRCTALIDNLGPKMLRDDVRRHVKYECREARRNDFTLFGIIKEKARAQHKYHVMAHEQKVKSNLSKKDKANDGNNNIPEARSASMKTANMQGATGSIRGGSGGAGGSVKQNLPKKETLPPKTGCWHCQGPHWLRDCPAASEDEKARAVEKMKEVRQATNGRVKKIGSAPARAKQWLITF